MTAFGIPFDMYTHAKEQLMHKLPKAEMTALMALISVGFTCGAVSAADTSTMKANPVLAADPGTGADAGATPAPAKKSGGKKHKKAKGGQASCAAKKGKEGSCKSGDAGATK
jgi:hypothetical protein